MELFDDISVELFVAGKFLGFFGVGEVQVRLPSPPLVVPCTLELALHETLPIDVLHEDAGHLPLHRGNAGLETADITVLPLKHFVLFLKLKPLHFVFFGGRQAELVAYLLLL